MFYYFVISLLHSLSIFIAVVLRLSNAVTSSIQFLMLWWSPTMKWLLLLLYNYNLGAMNHNLNVWYSHGYMWPLWHGHSTSQRGHNPEVENQCSKAICMHLNRLFSFMCRRPTFMLFSWRTQGNWTIHTMRKIHKVLYLWSNKMLHIFSSRQEKSWLFSFGLGYVMVLKISF